MKLRWGIIVFIVLFVINTGVGVYLYGLGKEIELLEQKVAFTKPLFEGEKKQKQEIDRLIKNGSNDAVDRLARYGTETKGKSVAFEAIVGLKKVDTPYANKKLRGLLVENNDTFVKKMSLAAYQIYGYKDDVESLESLQNEIESRKLRDRMRKIIELIKKRSKENVNKNKSYAFIEVEKKGQ